LFGLVSSTGRVVGPAETGSFTHDPNGNITVLPAPYSITVTTYDYRNLA
jgi:hypothetical protein